MAEPKSVALESDAGFRVLFKCATIGIVVISERGKIELSNPCAERLFGYGPSELIGKPVEILIPETLRDAHKLHREGYFFRPKARPMGGGMELYAQKKNGDVFPVEISLGHYELEGDKLAVAFITDITAKVNSKKLIAEREAWFRSIADNSPVMIWVSGPDNQYTYLNKTWLEFTGRNMDEELGLGWTTGIHPEDVGRYLSGYNDAFESRRAFFLEYRLKRHDGEYRWIGHAGKPTFFNDEFTGFIGSCSDIHEQRMMQVELEHLIRSRTTELYDALSREKEMNELKSRFVSMASHEFRTPLSIVMSSTTLLEQYVLPENDARIQKHLLRIKSSVNNLTSILNDFLSLDTLEQGKVELEYEPIDISEFMNEVTEGINLIRKKGQVITSAHKGDKVLMLDQKKLRYILVNLLSNSVKYSADDTEIMVSSENRERSVVIIVKDHGIGIPEEEQKFLYNKFFRAKNTGNVQGTGLGLTIVKRYVELMGGKIECKSKADEGTAFTLEIPTG